MSEMDELRRVMREKPAPSLSPRQLRAARTRARALSPVRIFFRLLSLPFVAVAVAISLYVRTSPYEPPDALVHLVARAGCDAALFVGLAPSYRGGLGYHAKNDKDGDGVACDAPYRSLAVPAQSVEIAPPAPMQEMPDRMTGGAKFVTP